MAPVSTDAFKDLYLAVMTLRKTVLRERIRTIADLKENQSRYRTMKREWCDTERFHQKVCLKANYHRASALLARVERALRGLLQNPADTRADNPWNWSVASELDRMFHAVESNLQGEKHSALPPLVLSGIIGLPYTVEIARSLTQVRAFREVPSWMGSAPSPLTGLVDAERSPGKVRREAMALHRRVTAALPTLSGREVAMLDAALLGVAA